MEFRVLGAIELWVEGGRRDLGTRKEQCALAVLLLSVGRVVSANALGECIWGEEPPLKARENLHAYISRLRKHLRDAGVDPAVLVTAANQGYRLDVPADCVDVVRFDHLVREADAAAAHDPGLATGLLSEALAQFGGEPLAGVSGEWAATMRSGLLERRRAAVLKRADLELRLGHHDRLIGELTELASRGPIDQTAVGLLMTALYNAGRLAESLVVFRETRDRLRRELGSEPGRELRELHQRILRGEPVSTPTGPRSAPPPAPPDTLDRDPPHFTGRADEVRRLLETIEEDQRAESSSVHVIAGMPGVGKTTLALHLAHRLRDRFPGGCLQLNLRGHDPLQPPMEPGEALVTLLRMLGTQDAETLQPASLDAGAALWRGHTAGHRLLLLLDDARDGEQIRALMPTAPGSLVLVTSRSRMAHLGEAHAWALDAMAPSDAIALFRGYAGPDRIDAPERLGEVAGLCGQLPLAIAVAAGYFRSRPSWRIGDLVERIADAWTRPDDGDELTRPVRVAFELSHRALTGQQRLLFRRLGLHAGDQISLHAAAMLYGAPAAETDRVLDALVSHNLIEEPERHRYRMHDLLREYAAQRARQDENESARNEAIRRLLDFYLSVATLAARTLQPHDRRLDAVVKPPPGDLPPVDTPARAQAWFSAEYVSILRTVRYCLEHRWFEHAARIPHALAQFLDRQGHWSEAVEVHESALHAWYSIGDLSGQARALTDLAASHWRAGGLDAASVCAQAALDLYRELSNAAGQSDALLELARVHWHARRPAEAEECLRACAALRERLGDRRGLAVAVTHLGILAAEFGSPTHAVGHFERALRIARELRDPTIERNCLNNLGLTYQQLDRLEEAMEHYKLAFTITQEIGGPQKLAELAHNIGAVLSRTGDHRAALDSFHSALSTYQEIGDTRGEIDTLINSAEPYLRLRRTSQALVQLQRALTLVEQVRDPLLSARVQHALGGVYRQQIRYPDALKAYRSALQHARRAAAPADQARALRRIGDILAVTRGQSAARQQWRKALALFEELDLPEAAELRGLPGLGTAETG